MWFGDWPPMAGLFMGVGMVIFWALAIWAVVWFVRETTAHGASGAKDVLDARYAAGEIDDDEYRRRLSTLTGRNER